MTVRKWECLAVSVVLLSILYLLLIPPIVGVADQGDFVRITAHVGLDAPSGLSSADRYNCWVLPTWNRVPPANYPYFSIGELAARIAVNLSKGVSFDIRWIAGVHIAILLGIILALRRAARKLPIAAYAVIGVGVVLVCTDRPYISYFNSFYGESDAFLGVLALVAAGLAAATSDKISWRHLFAIALVAAFFAGSKAQNVVLGPLAAGWLVCLFWNKSAHRYVAIAAGIALVLFAGVLLRTGAQPQFLFHTIYVQILPHSEDPRAALVELGLKPETAVWQGRAYWGTPIESADQYPGNATHLKVLAYYLRHPLVDLRIARDALSLDNDVTLGNYAKESGAPCGARTSAFTAYNRLRSHFASLWFVFPLLAANMAALLIWRTRMAGFITMLGTMAVVAFAIGSFYDNDPRKHLYTFNLLFDILLFGDVAAGTVLVSRWRTGLLVVPKTFPKKSAAALVLLLLLVFALAQAASFPALNLATGRPAAQSSTLSGYPAAIAGAAVDRQTNGSFFNGSVTHTNLDLNAWWQVDLGALVPIGSIVIWNRTDCCSERLSDYWVFVSPTPFSPTDTPDTLKNAPGVWSSHQTVVPRPSNRIAATGARGRYVRVQLSGTNHLSLAEVQVLGQ